ncbi:hypothetical protein [Roseomonas indoligenes]|uniref:Uncharacterized protein n=1 Tax=Roseomonas indoligenes TaxID=2820811 RepID=A0A940MVM7_9PROT|nr:hypothetical protein [Pararoseomonas indoligenes]MBP0492062.1 hypothetical protein [Pararoseomonas indoligenes]
MAGFIGRVAIILAVWLAFGILGVLAADSIPWARPPTSFDTVFSRYAEDIWAIASAGFLPGTILACRWRWSRDPDALRRDQSIAAGIVLLLLWTALVDLA